MQRFTLLLFSLFCCCCTKEQTLTFAPEKLIAKVTKSSDIPSNASITAPTDLVLYVLTKEMKVVRKERFASIEALSNGTFKLDLPLKAYNFVLYANAPEENYHLPEIDGMLHESLVLLPRKGKRITAPLLGAIEKPGISETTLSFDLNILQACLQLKVTKCSFASQIQIVCKPLHLNNITLTETIDIAPSATEQVFEIYMNFSDNTSLFFVNLANKEAPIVLNSFSSNKIEQGKRYTFGFNEKGALNPTSTAKFTIYCDELLSQSGLENSSVLLEDPTTLNQKWCTFSSVQKESDHLVFQIERSQLSAEDPFPAGVYTIKELRLGGTSFYVNREISLSWTASVSKTLRLSYPYRCETEDYDNQVLYYITHPLFFKYYQNNHFTEQKIVILSQQNDLDFTDFLKLKLVDSKIVPNTPSGEFLGNEYGLYPGIKIPQEGFITYEGNNHTIDGVVIDSPDNASLFYRESQGIGPFEINNLTIGKNSRFKGKTNVASVARGYCSSIHYVNNYADVICNTTSGSTEDCHAAGIIVDPKDTRNNLSLMHVRNFGAVEFKGNSNKGSAAGIASKISIPITVFGCAATGNVLSDCDATGLIRSDNHVRLDNAFFKGLVNGIRLSAGLSTGSRQLVQSCYFVGEIRGENGAILLDTDPSFIYPEDGESGDYDHTLSGFFGWVRCELNVPVFLGNGNILIESTFAGSEPDSFGLVSLTGDTKDVDRETLLGHKGNLLEELNAITSDWEQRPNQHPTLIMFPEIHE